MVFGNSPSRFLEREEAITNDLNVQKSGRSLQFLTGKWRERFGKWRGKGSMIRKLDELHAGDTQFGTPPA